MIKPKCDVLGRSVVNMRRAASEFTPGTLVMELDGEDLPAAPGYRVGPNWSVMCAHGPRRIDCDGEVTAYDQAVGCLNLIEEIA